MRQRHSGPVACLKRTPGSEAKKTVKGQKPAVDFSNGRESPTVTFRSQGLIQPQFDAPKRWKGLAPKRGSANSSHAHSTKYAQSANSCVMWDRRKRQAGRNGPAPTLFRKRSGQAPSPEETDFMRPHEDQQATRSRQQSYWPIVSKDLHSALLRDAHPHCLQPPNIVSNETRRAPSMRSGHLKSELERAACAQCNRRQCARSMVARAHRLESAAEFWAHQSGRSCHRSCRTQERSLHKRLLSEGARCLCDFAST
jgi:hypothetical protein